MLTRRTFLTGMLAAPAVVRAEILMPVRQLVVPERTWSQVSSSVFLTPPYDDRIDAITYLISTTSRETLRGTYFEKR